MTEENLIYHYCPSAAFLSIIENKALWLSEVSKTNDYSEGKDFLDHVKNFIIDEGNIIINELDEIIKNI